MHVCTLQISAIGVFSTLVGVSFQSVDGKPIAYWSLYKQLSCVNSETTNVIEYRYKQL